MCLESWFPWDWIFHPSSICKLFPSVFYLLTRSRYTWTPQSCRRSLGPHSRYSESPSCWAQSFCFLPPLRLKSRLLIWGKNLLIHVLPYSPKDGFEARLHVTFNSQVPGELSTCPHAGLVGTWQWRPRDHFVAPLDRCRVPGQISVFSPVKQEGGVLSGLSHYFQF